jgi:hypothetical protein
MSPTAFPARYPGRCAVCSKGFRRGTQIVRAPAMLPSTDAVFYDGDRRAWRDSRTGEAIRLRERDYAHACCAAKLGDYEDVVVLARARREALREHRRSVEPVQPRSSALSTADLRAKHSAARHEYAEEARRP